MAISYLICAAGLGQRMRVVQPRVPKALLNLNGRTLLEHSISCLPLEACDQLIIIGLKDHDLKRSKSRLYPLTHGAEMKWLEIDMPTRGQLETAFLALSEVSETNSIAIFNADSSFECASLRSLMNQPNVDGVIPCSIEDGEGWSFCAVENEDQPLMRATAVVEKERIAKWCSIGFYWFRELSDFKRLTQIELSERRGEVYVAPLYNRYINEGKNVVVVKTDTFKAMGTIDQVQKYWKVSLETMQKENVVTW